MAVLVESKDLRTNFYTFEGVVRALNGVGVVVENGETYGLVGESGCGKSVTVRSMMRIVQEPGQIENGRVVLFFNESDRTKGIDILQRSETYMTSIRGNDISMIFQEAGTSLNPVLSIGDQVGESFLFHRRDELLSETIQNLDERIKKGSSVLNLGRKIARGMFQQELDELTSYSEVVTTIDNELYRLEGSDNPGSMERRKSLNKKRDRLRKTSVATAVMMRIPVVRRYQRIMNHTIRRHVVDLLKSLGIPNPDNVFDRYPHELSGGMQQRIVIAMALACHPQLLIADEPTSNLDVTIQAQIVDLIKTLKETSISSVLFITHDLGLVAEICDRVTVMYAGDTCETASVKELFKNPLHPYTLGLLNSVPKVETVDSLTTIPGTVPNLIHPPSGCRFHPRCPSAMDICKSEKPEETEQSAGHHVSCHLF